MILFKLVDIENPINNDLGDVELYSHPELGSKIALGDKMYAILDKIYTNKSMKTTLIVKETKGLIR